jgi:flavin-binding protein dodecin
MPIVRNIDVTMQSEVSFDDACRSAVAEAAKTLRGIMSFRIKDAECVVEHDKIIAYRVTGKIVFLVERWSYASFTIAKADGAAEISRIPVEMAGAVLMAWPSIRHGRTVLYRSQTVPTILPVKLTKEPE